MKKNYSFRSTWLCIALFLFLMATGSYTSVAQCTNAPNPAACSGTITQSFNTNDGGFTSAAGNFVFSSSTHSWTVAASKNGNTYTITSGVYSMNTTGGVIGFATNGGKPKVSMNLKVLNASTNAILFQCTNPTVFLPTQVCLTYSGITAGTNVKYQFSFTTDNGSDGDGILSFDNFSNGGSAAALPVKLDNFDAVKDGSGIKLSWNTSDEINVKDYQIEKSFDGRNFVAIGAVDASNKKSYSFTDLQPSTENSFYRLKITDIDGNSRFSHIVSIKSKFALNILVSPNPVKDKLLVQHPKAAAGSHLQVIDINGKMLRDISIPVNAVETTIDFSDFRNGAYHVVFRTNTGLFSQTILKQ